MCCAGTEATATDRSVVQRSPTDSVCVCVCVRARACVCVIKRNNNPLHIQWEGNRGQTKDV